MLNDIDGSVVKVILVGAGRAITGRRILILPAHAIGSGADLSIIEQHRTGKVWRYRKSDIERCSSTGSQAADVANRHTTIERPVVVSQDQSQRDVIPELNILCFQVALVGDGNAVGNRAAREKGAGCGAGFEFFGQAQVELLLKHCNGGVIVIIFIGAQATVTRCRVHVVVPQNIEGAAQLSKVCKAGAFEIGSDGERHINDCCRTRSQAIDGKNQFGYVAHRIPIRV